MSTDLYAMPRKLKLKESHDAVSFTYKTKGQLLPEWLHQLTRLGQVVCYDDLKIALVFGEDGFPVQPPFDVSKPIYRLGDIVVLTTQGNLRVMQQVEFNKLYEDIA